MAKEKNIEQEKEKPVIIPSNSGKQTFKVKPMVEILHKGKWYKAGEEFDCTPAELSLHETYQELQLEKINNKKEVA